MHEKQRQRTSIGLTLVVSALLLLGCRLVTEGPLGNGTTPTDASPASSATATLTGAPSPQPATPTNTPLPSVTPTIQPTPSPTLPPPATATVSVGGSTIDGWLVYYHAAEGLMVLPPNSSEPMQLAPSPIYRWEVSVASGRLLVAFVTGAPGDTNFEIARALTQVDSLTWSPAGDRLAFMGAHQGSSSDLYLYDVAADAVTRLSSGPSQAIKPAWSPDGAYIVHLGVSTLGSGAGYGVKGMWAAAAGGEAIVTLDVPDESGDEVWLGWHGDHTLLVHSFNPTCGDNNLRAVDVANGESRTLWIGAFNATAFAPTTGHVLLSIDAGVGPCNPAAARGLLITHPQAQDNYIAHNTPVEAAPDLTWSPPLAAFLAATETVVTVTTTGETSPLPSPIVTVPAVSPDGVWAAWAGEDGLWLGRVGEEASQLYSDDAFLPRWTPGGSLLFFGADGLYHAPPPDFTATLLVQGAQARDAVLLEAP